MGEVKRGEVRRGAGVSQGRGTDLAAHLLDQAGVILSAEGARALTVRRVASAAGTSTMAVYTLFGDKQGLLAAMYRAGFERLGSALVEAAEQEVDPLAALAALGVAYRATALSNPQLYDLMFGRPVATFVPDGDSQAVADAAYRPLVQAAQRCLDAGQLRNGNADRIAGYLWGVAHGMVSLELAGHLPGDEGDRRAAYDDALALSVVPFQET